MMGDSVRPGMRVVGVVGEPIGVVADVYPDLRLEDPPERPAAEAPVRFLRPTMPAPQERRRLRWPRYGLFAVVNPGRFGLGGYTLYIPTDDVGTITRDGKVMLVMTRDVARILYATPPSALRERTKQVVGAPTTLQPTR